MAEQYNQESILSLGRIPHDTEEGKRNLEGAANGWIMRLEEAKWPRALQWFENASYLMGNHLTRYYYSGDGGFGFHTFGVHDSSQFDSYVAKVADNRLIRPVETVVAMLTQERPEPRVEPNSELPEDEDAALLSSIVLRLLFENPMQLGKKAKEAAMLGCISGTTAMEVEYGETDFPIEVPRTKSVERKNPLAGEPGEPDTLMFEEPDGTDVVLRKDISCRVWNSYHLQPDPAATCEEDMSWIARSTFEDIDWIRENFDRDEEGYFPENLDGISGDNASKYTLYWWSKFQDIIESPQYYQHGGGLTPQTFATHAGYAPNQAIFTVIDVKPTVDFPRGRTLILAGGKMIYCGDARAWSEKYPWRWHPYAFWGWFKIPGKFWYIPLLSEIVPLQKRINAIDSLVQANRQLMAIGQWMLPKHSKVAEGRLSGIPGEHIVYTDVPGHNQPERVPHVPLPAELLQEREQLVMSIDLIAASGMLGDKISKSAARAGSILQFLREEKLRSKSPMLQDFEAMLEKVGQNTLIEIQLHMEQEDPELTERIRVAAREHSSLTIDAFIGASLRDHHAVKIDIASALMRSPEADEAKAMEAAQFLGPLMTPAEKEGIWRATKLDRFINNPENASVKRARRMLARISSGQLEAALPMPGVDDPRAMAPIFQEAILSDRFYDYPAEVRGVLLNLFDHYAALAQEAAMQEFQMQLALATSGGAKQQGQGQSEGE